MEGDYNNFIFVTTDVSYKMLSDVAFKRQKTVAQFVSEAIHKAIEAEEQPETQPIEKDIYETRGRIRVRRRK